LGQQFSAVIPAKAGIHFLLHLKIKMDSRFRGNDGNKENVFGKATIGRVSACSHP